MSIVLLVLIITAFAALSLLGGRAYVGTLSGTLPASADALVLGLAYAATYFATVFIAPVLALYVATGIFFRASTGPAKALSTEPRH
jgi:hypothetical protein